VQGVKHAPIKGAHACPEGAGFDSAAFCHADVRAQANLEGAKASFWQRQRTPTSHICLKWTQMG